MKPIGILAGALAALTLSATAMAAGSDFYLEGADASITMPSAPYYCLFPNMDEGDETLAQLELTPQEVDALLAQNSILTAALWPDLSHEISVQVMEDSSGQVDNYAHLSQSQREETIAQATQGLEDGGYTVSEMSWVELDGQPWMCVTFSPTQGSWGHQYHTVYNGVTVSVTASSGVGAQLTDDIRAQVNAMAASVRFHQTARANPLDTDSRLVRGIIVGGVVLVVVALVVILTAMKAKIRKNQPPKAAPAGDEAGDKGE